MTLLPLPVILPKMHYHSALKWLLLNPSQSFLSPPQVLLPHEVQPWERSAEDEEVDSEEIQLKTEEDAEDEACDAFIGASSRHRRRCRAF